MVGCWATRYSPTWRRRSTACRPALRARLEGLSATHDFAKFWDMMRARAGEGSSRKPLSDAQRRSKPPVSHPVVLTHPLSGRKVLYANPGYTVRVDGLPARESDELLAFLFAHQLRDEYRYTHHWTEHDVLMWDNLRTIHNAAADYGPDEHRLVRRCQAMADLVFTRIFWHLGKARCTPPDPDRDVADGRNSMTGERAGACFAFAASRTCGERHSAGCPPPCSISSTAGPRTR